MSVGFEPIEQLRQEDGAGAVEAFEVREVDVNRRTPLQNRRHLFDGQRHGCCVREVGRSETPPVAVNLSPDIDATNRALKAHRLPLASPYV